MKNVLLMILFAFIASDSSAQIFKETGRSSATDQQVAYKDTMIIYKLSKDSIEFMLSGYIYKSRIEKNVVLFYYGNFNIEKNAPQELVLAKDGITHYFTPFVPQIVTPVISVNALPTQLIAVINSAFLKGNWEAYKRTNRNGPSNTIAADQMVKVVSFDTTGNASGTMKAFKNQEKPLYVVQGIDGSYLSVLNAQQKSVKLPVFELDERNFVFEDPNGIIYYCRKVK